MLRFIETKFLLDSATKKRLLEKVDEDAVVKYALDNKVDFESSLMILSGYKTKKEVDRLNKQLVESVENELGKEVTKESLKEIDSICFNRAN